MQHLLVVLLTVLLTLPGLTVSSADTSPTQARTAVEIPDLTLDPYPNASRTEVNWDVQIEYRTRDVQPIYDFYDGQITDQGWQRVNVDRDRDEFEVDYNRDGLRLELDVERDDGQIVVMLEIDDRRPHGAISLRDAPGYRLTMLPRTSVIERDWDIEITYDMRDVEDVFAHYDELVRGQGWTRDDLDRERSEVEATYHLGSDELELEVERDGRQVEVVIKVEDR